MNKFTLITGASAGIGYEMADIFAQNKNNLVLVGRNKDILDTMKSNLEKKYSIKVEVLSCDLSLGESAKKVFEFTQEKNIFIDTLVNNAGFGDYGEFLERNWQRQANMIQLNITTLTQLCYLFGNEMKKKKQGNILNVASTAAFQPGPLMSVYFATKSYVLHFSEALSNELSNYGIHVSVLCPGATATKFKKESEMADIKMFKNTKFADPYDVAMYGYQALKNKKIVAVHGFLNKLLVLSNRFGPRFVVLKTIRSLMEK